jgi:hypothetical protein
MMEDEGAGADVARQAELEAARAHRIDGNDGAEQGGTGRAAAATDAVARSGRTSRHAGGGRSVGRRLYEAVARYRAAIRTEPSPPERSR